MFYPTPNTSDTRCLHFPHETILRCSGRQPVSYNSTRFCHRTSRVSIRPHELKAHSHQTAPTSDASPKLQSSTFPSGCLLIRHSTRQPQPQRFARMVRRMQDGTLFLQIPVHCEGYNSGRAKWKGCVRQGIGKGQGAVSGVPTSAAAGVHRPA